MNSSLERKLSPALAAMVRAPSPQMQGVLIYGACSSCADHLRRRGIHISCELPIIGAYAASVPLRLLPILATKGYIRYLERDLPVRLCMDRADGTIDATKWHLAGRGGAGITIAAIDTGVVRHRDFMEPKNRIRAFVDLVGGKEEPYDDNGLLKGK